MVSSSSLPTFSLGVYSGCILQLKWPEQGVNTAERIVLRGFVTAAIPSVLAQTEDNLTFRKKQAHLAGQISWVLPLTVTFLRDVRGITGIVLLLNKARGTVLEGGGQRIPKIAYDLLNGYVVKKEASPTEVKVVDYLRTHPSRGTVGIVGRRVVVDAKMGQIKHQYFELYRPKPLTHWIGRPVLNLPLFKLYLISSVLKGLQQFHTRKIPSCNPLAGAFISFQGDLKPANLLLSDLGVFITDFGASNLCQNLCFSRVYAHPVMQKLGRQERKDWCPFQEKHGAQLDMWSVGILMAIVLRNAFSNQSNAHVPPFSFIEKYLTCIYKYPEVAQEEIDCDIARYKMEDSQKVASSVLEPLWELVHRCLRVNVQEIISLEQAINCTDQLLVSHSPRLKAALDKVDDLYMLAQFHLNLHPKGV